jgi:RNA-binding protein
MQDYSKKCLATATSSFIIGMKNPKKGMVINMTSKERAELKSQAMTMDSIFQIGKASLTPQMTQAIRDALHARELVKISVLKNCADDPKELARILAERTGSQVVQVIGKKIVLYKLNPEKEKKRRDAAKK